MTGPSPSVDLTDVDLFVSGRHLDAFAWLREHRPIHWNEGADGTRFWALTRYDDVQWAYREHGLFGSARGAILGGSFRSDNDTAAGRMLVASDLPRHRLLKQQIAPALSAAVERVGERVRVLLDEAVGRAVAAGGCDFATEIATELPAGALMVVFGIGHDEAHHLIGLTRRMVGFRDETVVDTGSDRRLRLAWTQAEIFEFFADLLARRRRGPADDLVSTLLTARVNGRRMSEEEIFFNCLNVAVGGNETSSYTACGGIEALAAAPDQYELLRLWPDAVPGAVEEMVRWGSVNAYVQRVALRDVERNGHLIRRGDSVTLWNVSANRDPAQFPDADRFDVRRSPNRHLSYGAGIHRCVGSSAAHRELSVLLAALLRAPGRFRLAGTPRRLHSNFILGTASLPMAVG